MPAAISRQHRQRGVALLTVLLVVALVTMLAASMLKAQQSLLQRSASTFSQDQAYLYALGAETLARVVLQDDADSDKNKQNPQDALNESWAKRVPPFPVEGGSVQARIEDLQGRFNLNNLWQDGQVNADAVAMYQRLLQQLGLSPGLASAVIDWLDPDNMPYDSEGAEEDWYLRLKPAYRSANRQIVDISELALLRGYTPEVVAKLTPYVCALPTVTAINVNTASPMLISALSDSISFNVAKQIVAERPTDGYGSLDVFLQQPVFSGLGSDARQALAKQLGLRSQYFQVLAEAEIDGKRRVLSSLIVRADGPLRTIRRDWSQQWQSAAAGTTSNDMKANP